MRNAPKPGALVFAVDIDRLAVFYEALLGMSVARGDRDHIVLESDSLQLVIHAIPGHIARSIVIASPPQVREDTPIKLLLPVTGIAEARAIAPSVGGRVGPVEREREAEGIRACDGVDPEGNVFQLRQRAT